MELSSPDSILEVIAGYGNSTRPPFRRTVRDASRSASKDRRIGAGRAARKRKFDARPECPDRRVSCVCGSCSRCLDNAKWERIFAEKFADPNYYSPRATRLVSPLTSF